MVDKYNIDVLKGNKKLIELIRKVDLKFPLVKEERCDSSWYYCGENFKLIIE